MQMPSAMFDAIMLTTTQMKFRRQEKPLIAQRLLSPRQLICDEKRFFFLFIFPRKREEGKSIFR